MKHTGRFSFRFTPILLSVAIFLGALESAVAADFQSLANELLQVDTVADLKKSVALVEEENRRELACEYQRRHHLPPTYCYRNARDEAELDLQCVKLSRSAVQIPKIDQFTSSICREALEKRRRDLEYAAL